MSNAVALGSGAVALAEPLVAALRTRRQVDRGAVIEIVNLLVEVTPPDRRKDVETRLMDIDARFQISAA